MKLLCFAHRAEAAAFFPQQERVRIGPAAIDLYRVNDDYGILITGEGIQPALMTTTAALTLLATECEVVLNFGIAGSLSEKLSRHDWVSIRTVYGEGYPGPLAYHSYSSSDAQAATDCYSAQQRVLQQDRRAALSGFAEIVDRELWGIAAACQWLQKPWQAFKVISDVTDQEVICQEIRDEAERFSEQLWQHFCQHGKAFAGVTSKPCTSGHTAAPLHDDELHYSKSQQDSLQKLVRLIAVRDHSEGNAVFAMALNAVRGRLGDQWRRTRPKDRTRLLLSELQQLAYPERAALERAIQNQLQALGLTGFTTTIAPNLEQPELRIHGPLASAADIERWQRITDNQAIAVLQQLLSGDRDPRGHDVS